MHVAFCAAVGYVTPSVFLLDTHQVSELLDHLTLEVVRIQPEVAAVVRVAHIVYAELQEPVEVRVVEVQVDGITDEDLGNLIQALVEGIQPFASSFRFGSHGMWRLVARAVIRFYARVFESARRHSAK